MWLYKGRTCFVVTFSLPLSLPFDWTFKTWSVCLLFSFVLFVLSGCYVVMLCVKKKIMLITKKLILLFSKDALNWPKVMTKTSIMLRKISISDKCCSSELSIHQRNLKKIYSAVFNIIIIIIIINVFWAANQNIRMISEGSCDWSNDAKNDRK